MADKGTRQAPLRARDVELRGKAAKEAKALQATMARHRAGYDAYVKARKGGEDREPYRAEYSAYKAAYGKLLKLRREAYARQQG